MKQKDKAKAYDEILTKAAALYKASEPMSGCNVILETLFPELKESEDGKVEKAIFGMVYDSDNESWSSYDVSKSDVLAWLEKQGEKEKDILEDAILDGNEDGLIAETIRYKHGKQDEKKPADSYCQENCKGFQETGKCFADGECKAKKEAEQKPAWSDEDEKMFDYALDMVEWYSGKNEDKSRLVSNWLKSLKSKVQPQNTK